MKLALACLVACAAVVAGCGGGAATQAERPALQRTLDHLVTGVYRVAPGAAAYVSGPKGEWAGSAGWSDVARGLRMTPDTRGRLASVSKLWTAVVVVRLAEQHTLDLDDTVERWLPGLFPDGRRMTVRELLNHTSGMIDNNDIQQRPAYYLAQIHDPALRARLLALSETLARDPAAQVPTMLEARTAAALPLVFPPGTGFHYSNIGYKVAGLIAEKAAHAPLAQLYRRFIVDPLHLGSAAYDPGASIAGPHAVGYVVEKGGSAKPATGFASGGLGAEGGIVTDARDEARFLVALVRGEIVSKRSLAEIESPSAASGSSPYGLGTSVATMCGGVTAFSHGGATSSYMSDAAVSADGSRVAVLLVNGRTWNSWGDDAPVQALQKLFCAA